MPYNNTPIAPPKEVSGQVSLPLARVQKIINSDPDRLHVSKNASFAIALATEMFIQHLATTTHNVVKTERKPRRNIQYRDVSSAVAKTDNLEFLVDVVPKTTTFGEFKKRQEGRRKIAGKDGTGDGGRKKKGPFEGLLNGDADEEVEAVKANGHVKGVEGEKEEVPEAMEVDAGAADKEEKEASEDDEPDPVAMQIEVEMRGPRANGSSPVVERRASGFTAINGAK